MTILSKNLDRLFKEQNLTHGDVARRLTEMGHKISRAGVSLWVPATVSRLRDAKPDHDKLLALAGMLGTSMEQLLTNPECKAGDLTASVDVRGITAWPDLFILEKTIKLLENNETLTYAYERASFPEKAYILASLYSLQSEHKGKKLTGKALLKMMDIKI